MAEFNATGGNVNSNLSSEPMFGNYGGSFTRIKDDSLSRTTSMQDATYAFDRLNIFESTITPSNTCVPNKTISNRNANAFISKNSTETALDVSNYLERPVFHANHAVGGPEQVKAATIYKDKNLENLYHNEKACDSILNKSSILDNPKENYRGLSTIQYQANYLFNDPQHHVTVDSFTRPVQTRQVVKDIYKQQVCAQSCKKGRTSYINGRKEELSNDYSNKICKQEKARRGVPNSMLLGTATFKSISGESLNTGTMKPGYVDDSSQDYMTFGQAGKPVDASTGEMRASGEPN